MCSQLVGGRDATAGSGSSTAAERRTADLNAVVFDELQPAVPGTSLASLSGHSHRTADATASGRPTVVPAGGGAGGRGWGLSALQSILTTSYWRSALASGKSIATIMSGCNMLLMIVGKVCSAPDVPRYRYAPPMALMLVPHIIDSSQMRASPRCKCPCVPQCYSKLATSNSSFSNSVCQLPQYEALMHAIGFQQFGHSWAWLGPRAKTTAVDDTTRPPVQEPTAVRA